MEVHARAPLSPIGRRRVVDRVVCECWSVSAAAEAAAVSERTVYRWLARFRAEGQVGLVDRRSVARRIPRKTPSDRVAAICGLRQLRLTAAEIAERLSMPLSTVSAMPLRREGLGKRSRLMPPEPVNRYERKAPGELVHIDIKKLGRIVGGPGKRVTGRRERWAPTKTDAAGNRRQQFGWEFLHVAIDDYSRLAYAEVLEDERTATAIAFLERALVFFAAHAAPWLNHYNYVRPHGSLSHKPPGSRLTNPPRNFTSSSHRSPLRRSPRGCAPRPPPMRSGRVGRRRAAGR